MALVEKEAAVYVKDAEAPMSLIPKAVAIVNDPERLVMLGKNAAKLARPDAAKVIAEKVVELAQRYSEKKKSNLK